MAVAAPAPSFPSSAPQDPSIPPADGSCPFETLPNELRDIVCDYAYVEEEPFRPSTKSDWTCEEHERHRQEKRRFVPGIFGPHYVDRFMISRSWLAGALKFFYEKTTFTFEDWRSFIAFLQVSASAYILEASAESPKHFCLKKVPAQTYLASVSAPAVSNFSIAGLIPFCKPGLKSVRLQLDSDFFDDSLDKHIEEDEWTVEDFEAYAPTKDLLKIEDLQNLVIEPHIPRWRRYAEERHEMLKRNVEFLAKLLQEEHARPRSICEPEAEPSPALEATGMATLYQGSPKYSPTSPSYKATECAPQLGSPMYSATSPTYDGPTWESLIGSPMYSATSPSYKAAECVPSMQSPIYSAISPSYQPHSPSPVREMLARPKEEKEDQLYSPLSPGVDPNQDLYIPISQRSKQLPRSSSPLREALARVVEEKDDPFNRPSPSSPVPATLTTSQKWHHDEGLRDDEIPRTKEEFARLVFERGPEVFDWVQGALERLKKVD